MPVCPICNGLRTLQIMCEKCGGQLVDSGKLMDYYDNYSPYMDIDLMKLEDGFSDTYSHQKCPHLYCCPHCFHDVVVLVNE